MLTLDRATRDAIVAHAKRDHPDEACGVVAGPEGSDRPERFVEMVNAAGSPTFYEFDSTDLFQLYKEMDQKDEEPVVVYHSHTATEAYPSRTDIGLAVVSVVADEAGLGAGLLVAAAVLAGGATLATALVRTGPGVGLLADEPAAAPTLERC